MNENRTPAQADTAQRAARSRPARMLALATFAALGAGLALNAWALGPNGLRGARSEPTLPEPPKTAAALSSAEAFLARGVWRAGACGQAQNFQAFIFGASGRSVEVGSGAPGQGERLELLRAGGKDGLVEVETRVCAPVGCNQTFEQYKVLDDNRMQEWRFEGRLPDQPAYVLVADGRSLDGTGPGRVFNRCSQ